MYENIVQSKEENIFEDGRKKKESMCALDIQKRVIRGRIYIYICHV